MQCQDCHRGGDDLMLPSITRTSSGSEGAMIVSFQMASTVIALLNTISAERRTWESSSGMLESKQR